MAKGPRPVASTIARPPPQKMAAEDFFGTGKKKEDMTEEEK